jgi:dipeptidyl aminopeptidase/acylaminoacyl peptidase
VDKVRQPRFRRLAACLLLTSLGALLSGPADAQDSILSKEAYLTPPKEIADAVLAPRHENVALTNLSPDGKKFLITKGDGMPTLQRMACPCVYLGEIAFDPVANRSRDLWIRSAVGFDIFYYADGRKVQVKVPEKARVSNPAWSPDGSQLAFFAHFQDATHIYLADSATGATTKLTEVPVLATLDTNFLWSKDGKRIQTILLPDEGKRVAPKHDAFASEPKVRVARGGNNPSRTYRFLLESPHDMKLLEHLATGQLTLIDVADRKITRVGEPSMIRSVSMAPGEQQFRVTLMKKPFSYFVPAARFGSVESIWSREGKNLFTLAEKELRDSEPTDPVAPKVGVGGKGKGGKGKQVNPMPQPTPVDPADPAGDPKGGPPVDPDAKRSITWRPDGAGMSYLQLEPAKTKDPKEVRKDRVLQWLPPFGKDDVKVVFETADRITSLQYSDDCQMLFLTQTIESQRQISAVDLKDSNKLYVISKGAAAQGGKDGGPAPDKIDQQDDDPVDDGEQQKKGGGFGGGAGLAASGLMTHTHKAEMGVVRISSAGEVYLTGTDRTGGAIVPRPFIDKIDIKTGKKTRIFQGQGEDLLESIDAVSGDDIKIVFTTRQKDKVVPDSYMNDLETAKSTKLTNNVDYTPWFHDLKVQRIQVTRVDGIKFWVKVTTSPKASGKQPAMFWIYPKEYTDQAAYDRSAGAGGAGGGGGKGGAGAGNRFAAPGPRSMAILTLAGYAVVEPDVPIIGPAGRMNDNYIPDLRNSLWAVIDELDKRGIIDRDRLACGGHSYGAFSTANALAHTPFFKAGIAGDGNYNRTLTSMTFQTEKRMLWDARETYLEMSPLLWANRVNGALLMYHGMDDANVGTNPINAEHLFMALDGLGKPAALYMYPYEGHGPVARETNLDQWARWIAWLDTYVKNAQKKK